MMIPLISNAKIKRGKLRSVLPAFIHFYYVHLLLLITASKKHKLQLVKQLKKLFEKGLLVLEQ